MNKLKKKELGFGIIEIIVAVAIFVIIAVTAVSTVVQTFSTNRLAKEETLASFFAQEGVEAVRSIKNQNWNNLSYGTFGLDNSSGKWQFLGSSDTNDKYTRQIVLSEVYRNETGNVIESGGTLDDDTYKLDSTVSWNFTPTRNNFVSFTAYLTNYEAVITPSPTPTPTGSPSPTPTPTGSPTPTPTSTPTSTPIPSSTPSPTVTPTPPASCSQYCQSNAYTAGVCRQNSGKCSQNGETYESAGDVYCTGGPASDTCCCQ